MRLLIVTVLAGVLLTAAPLPANAAPKRVPRGFIGVMMDGPLLGPSVSLARETRSMVSTGVESVRVSFAWDTAQHYRRFADIPPAERWHHRTIEGVPTSFRHFDRIMLSTARRRLRVLPVVEFAPGWATGNNPNPFAAPLDNRDFGRFLRALVRRYGPRGSFWRRHRRVRRMPIRSWQIWNEPDVLWPGGRWASGYVGLLREARRSVKSQDRRARIVLAGFVNYSWRHLATLYRAGGRRLFDIAAVHPYSREPYRVMLVLERVRRMMRRYRDRRKPLLITEFGWPSSQGKAPAYGPFDVTERGQAHRVRRMLPLLARHRRRLRLWGVYYYTWMSLEYPGAGSFGYAGLRRIDRQGRRSSKPAFYAFRRAALRLERCRRKGSIATRCARPMDRRRRGRPR